MKYANNLATVMITCFLVIGATSSFAQDAMKKGDAMAKDGMKKEMTMQDCKDHMAMAKKDGMKKDDAMMKKDSMCSDMMKKDSMSKDGMTKKDGMARDGMMKKDAASAPMSK